MYLINLAVQHLFFYFYILYIIFLQYFSVQPGGRRPFRALSDERFLAAGGQAAFAMSHERFGR